MLLITRAVATMAIIGVLAGGGFSFFKKQQNKQTTPLPTQTVVTILVPENKDTYIEKMIKFTQEGGENPLKTTLFVKKEIKIKPTEDPIKASAEAASHEIAPIGGGPSDASVAYFKVEKNAAYVLLDIDIDGWAGASVSVAIIHPLIEKTLLQFPEIKQVVFGYAPSASSQETVTKRATEVAQVLFTKNAQQIAALAHPTKGIRFSLYGQVDTVNNKTFNTNQITQYFDTAIKFTWGVQDGSGEKIVMPLKKFITDEFADHNYAQASEISYDTFKAQGNSINNIKQTYPLAHTVEFYFPGFNPKFDGMDWRAIHVVLEEYQGQWYVVGLVSNRWTI